jgi:16S rRNA (guanine1516-N2)-methyltransferase
VVSSTPASWADLNPATPQAPDGDVRGFSFVLETAADGRLQLRAQHRPAYGPIRADWQNAEMRSRIAAGRRQLLARACGLPRAPNLSILDATAGLGRDGYTLAALGARVTLCERHALIVELLRDAARQCATPLDIRHDDARALLASGEHWDVVLLDPMYPGTPRSALPGKEMQLFRELTGGDPDADQLLAPALAAARRRVAVKRPRHAPPLAGQPPDLQLKSNQARFDIYLRP